MVAVAERPFLVVLARPAGIDRAERHTAQGVARLRMDDGQVKVTDEKDERDVHQAVVQKDGAGEAEARVALAVPEQQAGGGEEESEGSRKPEVQLLPGVEAA